MATTIYNLAGSFITLLAAEEDKKIKIRDKWKLFGNVQSRWLLLAGASDPPSEIKVSERRKKRTEKDSAFLPGIRWDIFNMEKKVTRGKKACSLFNTVRNLFLTKEEACREIKRLFDECKEGKLQPRLYYTGHGEIGTGNWCFSNGTISIEEIVAWLPEGVVNPVIVSDACYSGHWANFCLNCTRDILCLAACPEFSKAYDTKGKGGDLTLFLIGKNPRHRTEPIFSGVNREDYPLSKEFSSVFYTDLITGHVRNTNINVICQCIHNGHFYGCFAPSERFSDKSITNCGSPKNYENFTKMVSYKEKQGSNIYSVTCDEAFGFGVVFMTNYGTEQIIETNQDNIQRRLDEDFKITACAARDSSIYVVMTKETDEYSGKRQKFFWCRNQGEVVRKAESERGNEMIITGICYSATEKKYFMIMTESSVNQEIQWLKDLPGIVTWMKRKHRDSLHPSIIFVDPATDGNVLVVATEDANRSKFILGVGYKLRQVEDDEENAQEDT